MSTFTRSDFIIMAESLDEKVKNINLEEKASGKKREYKGKGDKKTKAEVSNHALEVSLWDCGF